MQTIQTQQFICALARAASDGVITQAGHHQLPLDSADLEILIERDPQMAATLLLRLAHDLAERLQLASRELALRSQDF